MATLYICFTYFAIQTQINQASSKWAVISLFFYASIEINN